MDTETLRTLPSTAVKPNMNNPETKQDAHAPAKSESAQDLTQDEINAIETLTRFYG